MTLLTSGELQLKFDTAEFLRPEKNLPLRFPWKRIGLRRRAPVRTRPGYVYNRRRSAGMLKSVRTMLGNIVDLLMISLISSSGFLTAASFIADFIFRNWMKSWLLLVSFQSRGVYLTSESNAIARLKSELSVVFTVLDPCGNSRWMQELVGIRLSSGFPFHLYLTNMAPAINLDCKLVSELCMYGVGDAGSI